MWTNRYIGIPFKEKGRTREGLDCYGLVRLVLEAEKHISLPSFTEDYKTVIDGQPIQSRIIAESDDWIQVPKGHEREFDVVLMSAIYREAGVLTRAWIHVGIIAYWGHVLHVESGADAILESYLKNRGLNNRIISFYRHPELQ